MGSRKVYSIHEIGPLQLWRHLIQFLTFIFLNGKILGLASTGIIVPYLWSSGSPFSTVIGAYDGLEYTLAKGFFPLLVLGVIYLTGITVGRVFCGWACPFGMIQDILCYLPFKKEKLTPAAISQVKDIKWAILGFSLVISVIVGYNRSTVGQAHYNFSALSDGPFTVFSPASTLFSYLPWLLLWESNALANAGLVGFLKFVILLSVLVPSIYVPRFFCRYVCPLGALLEPVSPYKIFKIQLHPNLAKDDFNQLLKEVCPMDVQVGNENFISDPACIHCGRCMTEKPRHTSQKIF